MRTEGAWARLQDSTPEVSSLPKHTETSKGEGSYGEDWHEGSWVTCSLACSVGCPPSWASETLQKPL